MFVCEEKVVLITVQFNLLELFQKHIKNINLLGVALIDIYEESVAAVYLTEIHEKYRLGKYIYVKADISDSFDKTVQHFGQLDVVINVSDEANYERFLNINKLFGRHAWRDDGSIRDDLPKYKKSSGVIVNKASIVGVVPFPCPVYCINKHAVVSIRICYANDDACTKENIKIISIYPGLAPSPAYDKVFESIVKDSSANIKVTHSADFVGEALIQIMREGKSVSVWIVVDKKELTLVDYTTLHAD